MERAEFLEKAVIHVWEQEEPIRWTCTDCSHKWFSVNTEDSIGGLCPQCMYTLPTSYAKRIAANARAAIEQAEVVVNKRFEAVNEFCTQLTNQAGTEHMALSNPKSTDPCNNCEHPLGKHPFDGPCCDEWAGWQKSEPNGPDWNEIIDAGVY